MASRALRLAASAVLAISLRADDGFALHLLDTSTGGLCLDGTPGGFYLRNSTSADAGKWIIELEGGGWCTSNEDCLARASTDIGSSKAWPPRGCPGMDGGSNGMFSNDCSVSKLCNWTAAHMNYCDGASFAGYRADPVPVNGKVIYFRGRAVLDATLDALLALGLRSASEVILKGCSAGGLATLLHLDYVAARLRAANPGIRVVGLPDAGHFLDHTDYAGAPSYTPLYQWVAAAQNVTALGSVNDACVAAHTPTNDTWRCFMAQYTLPHIRTPLFMAQDLDDSWQMTNILRLPCTPYTPGSCNTSEVAALAAYRADMLASLAPLLSSPTNGGFLSTCVQHCHVNIDACYTKGLVQGQSVQDTFLSWYNGGALKPLVVDGIYGSNPTCFCSPYQRQQQSEEALAATAAAPGCNSASAARC